MSMYMIFRSKMSMYKVVSMYMTQPLEINLEAKSISKS